MKQPIFLLLSIAIFIAACSTPKKVVKPKNNDELDEIQSTIVFNPKTGKYDTIYVRNNKIDTAVWKTNTTKPIPPIGNNKPTTGKPNTGNTGKPNSTSNVTEYGKNGMPLNIKAPAGTKLKSSYNISYLLPFFTNNFSELDKEMYEKSLWALNFYAGAKLALDTLSAEGINLKVNVADTKAEDAQLQLLLKQEAIKDADVIIGTETNANVKITADFAKANGKIFISPYNPAADLVASNTQFVQINPSLRTNCEAIMRYVRKTYQTDQIVIICRDKANEREAMQYLQLENTKLGGTKLKEFILDEKTGVVGADIKGTISAESMAYIIPIWGQNSETIIYSLLNKINNAKGKRNFTVFGMPQWANFQVNGYDAFEPLKVHITQPVYTDKIEPNIKNFTVNYYNTYAAAPADESFIGYDLTLYVGRMLHRYGTKFNEVLDAVPFTGLQTKFNFEREKSLVSPANNETNLTYDRFANKYVNILKFENGCFNKVN